MTDELSELIQEKEQLKQRLNWLGIRSTGSDRIEERIRVIQSEIKRLTENIA